MDNTSDEYIVNLINKKGKRLHISYSEYGKLDKLIKEGKSEKYYPDIEWDLSHGYISGEQMWCEIENGSL